MSKLIIMRGVSGSGKSTMANQFREFARQLLEARSVIFSTDDYFLNEDGEYEFDGSKLGKAHQWNQGRVRVALHNECWDIIIVDNTNTMLWEMKPYVDAGLKYDADIFFYQTHELTNRGMLDEFYHRCRHGVPREVIEKQYDRFQGFANIGLSTYEEVCGLAEYHGWERE